jgi:hypothetical protein
MPSLESAKSIPPSALFLTTRTLKELGASRGEPPAQLAQAEAVLAEAQEKIFLPFLRQPESASIADRFEQSANNYAPIRLYVLTLLWNALGYRNFELRYIAALVKATEIFSTEAEKWGLDRKDVEQTQHFPAQQEN